MFLLFMVIFLFFVQRPGAALHHAVVVGHGPDGAEKASDIQPEAHMLHIPAVELGLFRDLQLVPAMDLRPAGQTGADIIEVQASKANGLVRLCEYYGMDISQTVAFGDSMNDYEIVQAAGTGIAMGNSVQKLKDTADYVTDDIARDGVWKACRHFGWI